MFVILVQMEKLLHSYEFYPKIFKIIIVLVLPMVIEQTVL